MPLDPELEPILNNTASLPYSEIPLAEARRLMLIASQAMSCDAPLADVVDLSASVPGRELPLRVYRPTDADGSALVYFHGGGWVLGSINTHDAYCRSLAHASGVTLISVDYRLAPEHPFPAAAEDAVDAVRWIQQFAEKLGVDRARIGVGGDSAGGNLAAVAAQTLRATPDTANEVPDTPSGQQAAPAICCQVLIYPIVDCDTDTVSYQENSEGFHLTRATMEWFWGQYAAEPETRADVRASPLRNRDLRGLPPALVITAEYDPLRDEGELYARRLADSGNSVELKRFDGMIHGFVRRQRELKAARRSLEHVSQYLRRQLRT